MRHASGAGQAPFSSASAFAFSNCDRAAIAVLLIVTVIALLTFRDYGLGWDDYTHSEYGDLLVALYGSGFRDTRALSFVNLFMYGGGFDTAAALAAKIFHTDLFATRRLMNAAVGIAGLTVTWRLARHVAGPLAGVIALALLATCPVFYGHMFMNAKDAPFAVAILVLLFGLVRAVEEYPQPSRRTVVLLGLGLGLAFGSRILAAIGVVCALPSLLTLIVADARRSSLRAAATRWLNFAVLMLPALVLGYLIMGLLWPWSILEPLNPFRAVEYFANFFEKPWRELYQGNLILVPDMPASYLPQLFALKLPEIMLALGVAGMAGTFVAAARADVPPARRAVFLLLALAALLPVAIAMVTRPALYNGVRHFLFILPPFAVLGGLAGAWLVARLSVHGRGTLIAAGAIAVIGFVLPIVDMVRLHPFQYLHFNTVSGGVQAARGRYMLDYWGLSFRQASLELRARLEAEAEIPPDGRPWVVAVCGPERGAQIALGPRFTTTAQSRGADFELMLDEFYCRPLPAPVIARVAREGVEFSRIYDIRGLNIENLLTMPPP